MRSQQQKSCKRRKKHKMYKVILLHLAVSASPSLPSALILSFVFSRKIAISISSPAIFSLQKINERKQAHLAVIVFLAPQVEQFKGLLAWCVHIQPKIALSHFSTCISTSTHALMHNHMRGLTHYLQLRWRNKHIDKTISLISSVCQNVIPQPLSYYHSFNIYSGSLNNRPRRSCPTVIPITTSEHTLGR